MTTTTMRPPRRTITLGRKKLAHRIAFRLRRARERKGLSMLELANRVGVYCSTIARIESASLTSNVDLLMRLARELDLTLNDLCGSGKKSSKK